MRRVIKIFSVFALLASAFFLLCFSIGAEEISASLPDGTWESFEESLPDEAAKYFSDGAFESEESYFSAIEGMTTPKNIALVLLELFGVEMSAAFSLLLLLLAVTLVSSALSAVSLQSESGALKSVMRFCSLGGIFCSAGYIFYSHFERLEEFFGALATFINGMIPVVSAVWALGGNVTTASAGSAALYCFLTVFEKLWAASAVPIFALLLTLGFCDVLCGELKTGRVVGTVKRIYGFFLGLTMTILLSSLAAQTTLTAVADSVTARAGRLVTSTVIPIVGGNLGESLRTVASGVIYLKSIFGIGGIIIVALLTLPTAISLLLTRFVFEISSTFADILGCEEESKLLACFSDAYGCVLAVVAGAGMTFVLSLCIFMKTAVAAA